MKLIILCSALDLTKPYGSTPALWQLFKGLSESGNELFIMPYHGHAIDSLWWKSIPNPNYLEGEILQRLMNLFKASKRNKSRIIPFFARAITTPKIENTLLKYLNIQKNVDAVIMVNIPLNQIKGLARKIKSRYGIPVMLYDIDVPTSLPSGGGFTFNHYLGANLTEFDSFIIPSEGSINILKEMGANNVDILHFGVDPEVYKLDDPGPKEFDLFFYGTGGKSREKNIRSMITEPSKKVSAKFLISGNDYNFDLGNSTLIPLLSFNRWKNHCGRSKINLNVVRDLHASVYATSTSRPFELAAMNCCIVSSPYSGLERWFDIGKEIIVANSPNDAIGIYQNLLDDPDQRDKMGRLSYNRVIKEHTSKHRAMEMLKIIEKYR
ncbi:CgeB family protein [Candidatus Nitrosocosmicus sp. R]